MQFPLRFAHYGFIRPENEKAAEFRGLSLLELLERVRRFERPTPTLATLSATYATIRHITKNIDFPISY
jgi:hypothetical protein